MVTYRLSRRIPFRSEIKYGLHSPTSEGYSFNLSEGGMEIRGNSLLPLKSKIIVNVVINDKIEEFIGRIVWTTEKIPGFIYSMGIKFLSPSEKLLLLYAGKTEKDR